MGDIMGMFINDIPIPENAALPARKNEDKARLPPKKEE
jgi:hypothetical protein